MALQSCVLATIELKLRQDGSIILEHTGIEGPELVAILDSGREPYENAHTVASTIALAREAYEKLSDNIKDYIT